MIKKTVLSFVGIVVLVAAAATAYYYYYPLSLPQDASNSSPLTQAVPDNSVMAGPIQSITDTSITIKKQDGTLVSFGIASSTRFIVEGVAGAASSTGSKPKSGKVALITPNSVNPTIADTVIIVSPPQQ